MKEVLKKQKCVGWRKDADDNWVHDKHDIVMINRIKADVKDWMETHGQVMMGEEISDDVCNIIDESVNRTIRIREDWMLPDRS